MDKVYERINWENEPSVSSPLNATNLNRIDYAVDELDNRVISLDTTKISKAETASDIVGVSLDEDTGIFTFTRRDGSTIQFDTKLEKVAVNWTYDSETEKLVLTLDDGTTQEVDLSKLITVYEFLDSDTIAFSINSAGKVVAIVKNGAITEEHLAFDYLGEIKVESAKAETASASASVSAQEAKQYRDEAKTFRDEAEAFAPDGYDELKQQVAENSARIDAVIELSAFQIQNSASGDNLHLTDSADSKAVSFNLYGKAGQKQYSGKNLQNPTNILKGYPDASGTSTDATFVSNTITRTMFFEVSEGTTYTVTLSKVGNRNILYFCNSIPSDFTTTQYYYFLKREEQRAQFSFEAPSGYKYCAIYIGSDFTENEEVQVQAEKGTQATPYEPYTNGPSPNPDYPQEITVAGASGSVEVVSCGKNLCKPNNTHFFYDSNNLIVENTSVHSKVAKVEPNTTVTVSKSKATNRFQIIGCEEYPTVGSACKLISSYSGDLTEAQVTIPSDVNYIFVYYLYSSTTESVLIQVENGTVSTEFQEYTETTSTIPTDGLCGIKVSRGGNYTDENGQQWIADEIVKYADGSGKRIERIGKTVFDGSSDEAWLSGTTGTSGKYRMLTRLLKGLIKTPPNNNTAFIGLSTIGKLIPAGGKGTYDCVNGISVNSSGTEFHVYSDSYNTSDVSLWTSYLAENPMTLYYELAEPIITDLTAEELAEIEKLHTFYPVTNISNDADCGMSITFLCDAKNYIDNRLALIESAMLNNI